MQTNMTNMNRKVESMPNHLSSFSKKRLKTEPTN